MLLLFISGFFLHDKGQAVRGATPLPLGHPGVIGTRGSKVPKVGQNAA